MRRPRARSDNQFCRAKLALVGGNSHFFAGIVPPFNVRFPGELPSELLCGCDMRQHAALDTQITSRRLESADHVFRHTKAAKPSRNIFRREELNLKSMQCGRFSHAADHRAIW